MPSLWAQVRSDFPITKRCIYLDHASGGPLPRPVHEKISAYWKEHYEEADLAWPRWIRRREEVREKVARFINAEPSEVTFISSTSQGINLAADLIAKKGKVLTNTPEFPSSTAPWLWRKTPVVWQRPRGEVLDLEDTRKLLTPSVKTIVTSYVQYGSGFRQDLEALGKIKGGRFLVVNATQAFGAMKMDVKKWDADFMCANSYKWMLAGYGGGVFYVRKKWLEKFKPAFVGWRSMNDPEEMNNRKLDLNPAAMRYEYGCPDFPAIFAVGAAIDYFNSIGAEKIEERILDLTEYAMKGLDKAGLEILTPRARHQRGGIVIFKTKDPEGLRRKLVSEGIYLSVRGGAIRIAPHFYNSFEEIDAFLKKLGAWLKGRP